MEDRSAPKSPVHLLKKGALVLVFTLAAQSGLAHAKDADPCLNKAPDDFAPKVTSQIEDYMNTLSTPSLQAICSARAESVATDKAKEQHKYLMGEKQRAINEFSHQFLGMPIEITSAISTSKLIVKDKRDHYADVALKYLKEEVKPVEAFLDQSPAASIAVAVGLLHATKPGGELGKMAPHLRPQLLEHAREDFWEQMVEHPDMFSTVVKGVGVAQYAEKKLQEVSPYIHLFRHDISDQDFTKLTTGNSLAAGQIHDVKKLPSSTTSEFLDAPKSSSESSSSFSSFFKERMKKDLEYRPHSSDVQQNLQHGAVGNIQDKSLGYFLKSTTSFTPGVKLESLVKYDMNLAKTSDVTQVAYGRLAWTPSAVKNLTLHYGVAKTHSTAFGGASHTEVGALYEIAHMKKGEFSVYATSSETSAKDGDKKNIAQVGLTFKQEF